MILLKKCQTGQSLAATVQLHCGRLQPKIGPEGSGLCWSSRSRHSSIGMATARLGRLCAMPPIESFVVARLRFLWTVAAIEGGLIVI
jgi:hypothetical protein